MTTRKNWPKGQFFQKSKILREKSDLYMICLVKHNREGLKEGASGYQSVSKMFEVDHKLMDHAVYRTSLASPGRSFK